MKDIWNLQPGTCIVVDANQYGQPIGKETSKLAEFLCTIAMTGSICHFEKFDLQGKVEDFDILSYVGKLQKEFKSTLKTRYYREMVQEGTIRKGERILKNDALYTHRSMHNLLRRKVVNPCVWSSLDFNIFGKMGVTN
ncbi:hypothetical protein GOBAR_AA22302 [Gossypium barbadense]|uniref:Uncharacterized protein n=1 Tax=Gossypium barbadense TaxID=3634 RepID=A0A2P5X4V9_GOSBA|nr:hypothetical protein GOBAR_AA22302 [Gossypium barbadense]